MVLDCELFVFVQYVNMSETFPENFMCIGERTFLWVFENRKEFVDFTVNEMDAPTGLFLKWQKYCKERLKISHEK